MDTPDGQLVTADDVLLEVQRCLETYLPASATAAGLAQVTGWAQLPTPEALSTATFPVGAITSPGLANSPTRDGQGWNLVWRVAVAVYDRGGDYGETAARTRTWAALVRGVLARHLLEDSQVAWDVVLVGEEYALRPETSSARTLGGCAVALDVDVRRAVPITGMSIPHIR